LAVVMNRLASLQEVAEVKSQLKE